MGLETLSLKYLFENAPEVLVFIVALCSVFLYVALRVNAVISKAQADREMFINRIDDLEKQQRKNEQLLSAAPCISKNNGLWLQDPKRNGGQPPEPIKCQYLEARRRVDE